MNKKLKTLLMRRIVARAYATYERPHKNSIIQEGHYKGLRYVSEEVGYVDEDEEYR